MKEEKIRFPLSPKANPQAVITGEHYRFTVLTPKLIRLEYAENGMFEDRATQTVLNREFPVPAFRKLENDVSLEIITEAFHLHYLKKGPFSPNALFIDVKSNFTNHKNRWYFGTPVETLKGTARTLDQVDGETELEEGILSKKGYAVLDDSESFILVDEETIEPRKNKGVDLYFFAYGRSYLEALRDFYKLAGAPPLLPRFVFGNWWSRYWPYKEQEYKTLVERFENEDIPFSVAVLDMDWHLVDIPAKYGSGWTGYTWNKELFPDPKAFLDWLHARHLKVTLNLHPADGVRAYEEMYPEMAVKMGIDPETGDPILFDINNRFFRDAYFEYLHHPQEKDGVDFWWIDWQQGTNSSIEGLDPLWLLNHFHTLDRLKSGKRPLILSRYAGAGSHRYPIGFSGDTVVSWDSYRFQPYFTATASNIGYSWWSHDIGGHFGGARDDELAVRWVQFGTFSPILRLHSTQSEFMGKEPWKYGKEAADAIKAFLRLRHRLVPYLYTMNWRTHHDLLPLVMPMYGLYPLNEEAYDVRHQYFFGSELVVAPVTEKRNPALGLACVKVWLPFGTWYDFFTGHRYEGGTRLNVYRGLGRLPVFAKAGAIIPLAGHCPHKNGTENPKQLDVLVFPGSTNTFVLYEDDGETLAYENGAYALTKFELDWEQQKFIVHPVEGDLRVLPVPREIRVLFRGFGNIEISGYSASYEEATDTTIVRIAAYDPEKGAAVSFSAGTHDVRARRLQDFYGLLNAAQIAYRLKEEIYALAREEEAPLKILARLRTMNLDPDLFDAVFELIYRE